MKKTKELQLTFSLEWKLSGLFFRIKDALSESYPSKFE